MVVSIFHDCWCALGSQKKCTIFLAFKMQAFELPYSLIMKHNKLLKDIQTKEKLHYFLQIIDFCHIQYDIFTLITFKKSTLMLVIPFGDHVTFKF